MARPSHDIMKTNNRRKIPSDFSGRHEERGLKNINFFFSIDALLRFAHVQVKRLTEKHRKQWKMKKKRNALDIRYAQQMKMKMLRAIKKVSQKWPNKRLCRQTKCSSWGRCWNGIALHYGLYMRANRTSRISLDASRDEFSRSERVCGKFAVTWNRTHTHLGRTREWVEIVREFYTSAEVVFALCFSLRLFYGLSNHKYLDSYERA